VVAKPQNKNSKRTTTIGREEISHQRERSRVKLYYRENYFRRREETLPYCRTITTGVARRVKTGQNVVNLSRRRGGSGEDEEKNQRGFPLLLGLPEKAQYWHKIAGQARDYKKRGNTGKKEGEEPAKRKAGLP